MMRKLFILGCGFALAILCSIGLGQSAERDPFDGPILVPAQVERVYDADTIYVRAKYWTKSYKDIGARVNGVDTPEKRGSGCKSHPLWKSGKLTAADKARFKAYENDLGKHATKVVSDLIKAGDWVLLRNVAPGKYAGRAVVDVHYANSLDQLQACAASLDLSKCPSIGAMLIEQQLAVPYDGGTKSAWWCEGPPMALPSAPKTEEGD
ncbi:thermonuclease family protein [Cohaesibacter celericrescens]|uniref:Uncharacterized protein n=1 Tax=Cohaesibacter celericrescens TaxID=2067669 RepID=A0A2N5XX74_9HYPH|nr:hypothetical protein [Cohaesibacter celericrescens]PLW79057.1 hypothetical protein C0081_02165 [Cohaesibacter celericrescens]